VNPWPEGDIAVNDEIAGAQDQGRMDQPFFDIKRKILA
jgi:hypothetical protein